MPTNRRRRKVQRRGFRGRLETSWQAMFLVEGWTFLPEDEMDDDTRYAAWRAYQDVILEWWTENRAGTRPSVWWIFEAPKYGERQCMMEGDQKRWESDKDFLERHGLLTPRERELIANPKPRPNVPWRTGIMAKYYEPWPPIRELYKAMGCP